MTHANLKNSPVLKHFHLLFLFYHNKIKYKKK